jgi:Mg2+ and Co2+ transporter CorA
MSISWYLAKNHHGSQLRTSVDFGSELSESIAGFESAAGVTIDQLLIEELGARDWLGVAEAPSNYSHPVIRAEAHGEMTLFVLAVPASLHNGVADFTNVMILAHPRALLMVIRDPAGAYAADFGGRLLEDFKNHITGAKIYSAGEAVFRAVRSCALSVETSLSVLRATIDPHLRRLRSIELRQRRVGQDLDELEAEFGKALAELRAMSRSPQQLLRVCGRIEEWSASQSQGGLFESDLERRAVFLNSKLLQLDAILSTLMTDIERAIKRCDDVSKRELLDAQRNNTYWTSALLLPNLIFAFFGQSFLGDAREGAFFWFVSGSLLILYGVGSTYFLFRRGHRT